MTHSFRPTRALSIGVAALAALPLLAACSGSSSPSSVAPSASPSSPGGSASTPQSPESPHYTLGSLPTFLPSSAVTPDAVLDGSAARMALTTQGDAVRVHLPSGTAMITVTGPRVPGEGLPFQADATTCTWTVDIRATSGTVPIDAHRFDVIDHLGARSRPFVPPTSARPPRVLAAGRHVTFALRAGLRTGEGLVRWAPDGRSVVAEWDFVVEID